MLPPLTHSRDPRLDISQARQVLKDALRTHDAREIVKWLRAEGVVGRTGRPLGLAQVHAIVKAA